MAERTQSHSVFLYVCSTMLQLYDMVDFIGIPSATHEASNAIMRLPPLLAPFQPQQTVTFAEIIQHNRS
jgi:hypothetical protein